MQKQEILYILYMLTLKMTRIINKMTKNQLAYISFTTTHELKDKAYNIIQNKLNSTVKTYLENKLKELINKHEKK